MRIQQMNGAGQVYDTAGSRTDSRFVHNLDKHLRVKTKQGRFRSRVMFRAVKNNFGLVEKGVQRVIGRLEQETERRLTRGIGGIN